MIIQANDTISRRFLRDSTKLWVHSVFSFSQSWFCIRLFRLNSTDKQQFPIWTWYITKLLHKNINRNPYYYWTWFCGQIILHPYVEHVLAGNIMCVCVLCTRDILDLSECSPRHPCQNKHIFIWFFLLACCLFSFLFSCHASSFSVSIAIGVRLKSMYSSFWWKHGVFTSVECK